MAVQQYIAVFMAFLLACAPLPVLAIDSARFDLIVERLEAIMDHRNVSTQTLVRALTRLRQKQVDPEKIELLEALESHFSDDEARIRWIKEHAAIRTIETPSVLQTQTWENEKPRTREEPEKETETPISCPSGSHSSDGECIADTQTCSIPNWSGTTTWDKTSQSWGACQVEECSSWYALSADWASCEASRFPGCSKDDMLIGGLFWAMCDSTGSRYSNHYFSRDDGERACPADYRLPTVAEWTAAYREKLSGESESDENRWKYLTKLATDLSLSARGRLWIDRHMSVVANTFSLKEPEPIEIDYGDIPERYRSDAGEPTIVYSYGEYQYLAADGFMGLSYRYDEENPTSSATLSRYPEDADTATLSHILMSVRCVRK